MTMSTYINENQASKKARNKEQNIKQNQIRINQNKAEELPSSASILKTIHKNKYFQDNQPSTKFENFDTESAESSKISKKNKLDSVITNLEEAMKNFIEHFKDLNQEPTL